jgi:imidazolonepropionase-like amidohydrolase
VAETTPKLIFPQRKIGGLEVGYEANFLVLEGNPIQDFSKVKSIKMRVKRGNLVN